MVSTQLQAAVVRKALPERRVRLPHAGVRPVVSQLALNVGKALVEHCNLKLVNLHLDALARASSAGVAVKEVIRAAAQGQGKVRHRAGLLLRAPRVRGRGRRGRILCETPKAHEVTCRCRGIGRSAHLRCSTAACPGCLTPCQTPTSSNRAPLRVRCCEGSCCVRTRTATCSPPRSCFPSYCSRSARGPAARSSSPSWAGRTPIAPSMRVRPHTPLLLPPASCRHTGTHAQCRLGPAAAARALLSVHVPASRSLPSARRLRRAERRSPPAPDPHAASHARGPACLHLANVRPLARAPAALDAPRARWLPFLPRPEDLPRGCAARQGGLAARGRAARLAAERRVLCAGRARCARRAAHVPARANSACTPRAAQHARGCARAAGARGRRAGARHACGIAHDFGNGRSHLA